jgi:hypothetical protein
LKGGFHAVVRSTAYIHFIKGLELQAVLAASALPLYISKPSIQSFNMLVEILAGQQISVIKIGN